MENIWRHFNFNIQYKLKRNKCLLISTTSTRKAVLDFDWLLIGIDFDWVEMILPDIEKTNSNVGSEEESKGKTIIFFVNENNFAHLKT